MPDQEQAKQPEMNGHIENKVDPRTHPTDQERAWALAIKEAAEQAGLADGLSDLEFVQHAIIAKDQVAKALQRIERLAAFKQHHGILQDGSVAQGVRDTRTFLQMQPGFSLSLAASAKNDTHILCASYRHFLARKMKSDESFAVFMRGNFYILQATQCSLAAMRTGVIVLCDAHGVGFRNLSMGMEERSAALYSNSYPIGIQKMVMMRANFWMRLLKQLCRPFMSKKAWERHVFTADLQAYLEREGYDRTVLPTIWGGTIAVEEFEKALEQKLRQRYELAAKFKL